MLVLGLAGYAGSGKDTVADYLVARYGFIKFSFSDQLYAEVQQAFGLPDQKLLRDRATKEVATPLLCGNQCVDGAFAKVMIGLGIKDGSEWHSPRNILQWWGTEYRRKQDPDYWLEAAGQWLEKILSVGYPEHRASCFVNTSVRFQNEQRWIHGYRGNVWHVERRGFEPVNGHVSETPLIKGPFERTLRNNDTVDRLGYGVDLLLKTNAPMVAVEPMLDNPMKAALQ